MDYFVGRREGERQRDCRKSGARNRGYTEVKLIITFTRFSSDSSVTTEGGSPPLSARAKGRMGLGRRGFPLTLCFVASVAYSPPAAIRSSLKCHDGPSRSGSCCAASADYQRRAAHARIQQLCRRHTGLHDIFQPLLLGRGKGFAGGAPPARAGGRMAMSSGQASVDLQTLFDFERNGHVAIRQLIGKDQTEAAKKALLGHLNSRLKEAYVFKMELLAADCEDDELLEMSKKCKTAQQAKKMLKDWCDENEMEVPFLQVSFC